MPAMRSVGLRKGTKEPLMFSHTPATRFVLMCFVLGMMCLILGIPECKQVNSGGPPVHRLCQCWASRWMVGQMPALHVDGGRAVK